MESRSKNSKAKAQEPTSTTLESLLIEANPLSPSGQLITVTIYDTIRLYREILSTLALIDLGRHRYISFGAIQELEKVKRAGKRILKLTGNLADLGGTDTLDKKSLSSTTSTVGSRSTKLCASPIDIPYVSRSKAAMPSSSPKKLSLRVTNPGKSGGHRSPPTSCSTPLSDESMNVDISND